ncbi:MAG: polysulfide reductase NrfD [Proteobacteria bacterium]|nr:polysulfide reductase NrfD [Pseudomonadota bacterium]MBU1416996.1 polysulfide reductase NrfD [Pseudomonadota bacterium]MBU1453692.1 polysulfide reductase NrfD [Pseudomonadota bacterium]
MTGRMVNISKRWGFHGVEALRNASTTYKMVMGFFVLLALAGAVVGLHGLLVGYHHVYGVTREISWGLLISAYIFCVVTSTGLCIVSSIGHVFGGEAFMPIAKRAVFMSIMFMFGGFCIIFFDIENPFRMAIWNVFSPNFVSNMWWMGTLYGAYLVFMVIEYYFLLEQNHTLSRLMGFFGLVVGIAAHSNLGAVFGMLHGRPFWYGPYLPIYFIFSAAMSGGCAILFFTTLGWRINPEIMNQRMERSVKAVTQITIFLISVIIFFTIWKIITGMVSEGKHLVIMSFLSGDYAINFWVFEVFLGMFLPLYLLIRSRGNNFNLILTATGLMMIGIFFMRYDIVIPGQMESVYHSMGVVEAADMLTYTPSFHEIMASLFGIAFIAFAYFAGEKMLNGHQLEKHEIVPEGGYICPGCGAIHYMEEGETEEDAMKRHHRIW